MWSFIEKQKWIINFSNIITNKDINNSVPFKIISLNTRSYNEHLQIKVYRAKLNGFVRNVGYLSRPYLCSKCELICKSCAGHQEAKAAVLASWLRYSAHMVGTWHAGSWFTLFHGKKLRFLVRCRTCAFGNNTRKYRTSSILHIKTSLTRIIIRSAMFLVVCVFLLQVTNFYISYCVSFGLQG